MSKCHFSIKWEGHNFLLENILFLLCMIDTHWSIFADCTKWNLRDKRRIEILILSWNNTFLTKLVFFNWKLHGLYQLSVIYFVTDNNNKRSREWEDKLLTERKCLQKTQLIKNLTKIDKELLKIYRRKQPH